MPFYSCAPAQIYPQMRYRQAQLTQLAPKPCRQPAALDIWLATPLPSVVVDTPEIQRLSASELAIQCLIRLLLQRQMMPLMFGFVHESLLKRALEKCITARAAAQVLNTIRHLLPGAGPRIIGTCRLALINLDLRVGSSELIEQLQHAPHLAELQMVNCGLTGLLLDEWCATWSKLPGLIYLDLRGNVLTQAEMEKIRATLPELERLLVEPAPEAACTATRIVSPRAKRYIQLCRDIAIAVQGCKNIRRSKTEEEVEMNFELLLNSLPDESNQIVTVKSVLRTNPQLGLVATFMELLGYRT